MSTDGLQTKIDIMKKSSTPDYPIPKTNAEGLTLVWTRIYPAELARQLSAKAGIGKTISRAGTAKWKSVPLDRVNHVAEITGLPREHILPEVYAQP